MNVYDFDKTILKEDSSLAFWMLVMKQNPTLGLKYGSKALTARNKWKKGKITREEYKNIEFSYLEQIDVEAFLDVFMEEEILKINEWYYAKHKPSDIIISASPEFIIERFCKKLDVTNFIASKVDIKTGEALGKNCYGEEKVIQFRKKYGDVEIDEFYSDSLSDTPLAKLAKKAYLVKGNKFVEWPFEKIKEDIKEIKEETQ